VADALRESSARMRFAILDCCFAGQAIEAMAADTNEAVADITHVEGVYTLTATTRNRTAHVPPADQQDTANTSFTGALIELIMSGIPQGPANLTLGVIYRNLRTRLAALGLPLPNQRNTDLAEGFVFSKNIWTQPETPEDAGTDTPEDAGTDTPEEDTSSIARRQLAAQAFFGIATDDNILVEDRLEAADRLARLNEQQGAEALFEIGTDDSVDTENRRAAAQKLTGLNEELAAKAFDNIAIDKDAGISLSVNSIIWAMVFIFVILSSPVTVLVLFAH
jgi:hypothetical protein